MPGGLRHRGAFRENNRCSRKVPGHSQHAARPIEPERPRLADSDPSSKPGRGARYGRQHRRCDRDVGTQPAASAKPQHRDERRNAAAVLGRFEERVANRSRAFAGRVPRSTVRAAMFLRRPPGAEKRRRDGAPDRRQPGSREHRLVVGGGGAALHARGDHPIARRCGRIFIAVGARYNYTVLLPDGTLTLSVGTGESLESAPRYGITSGGREPILIRAVDVGLDTRIRAQRSRSGDVHDALTVFDRLESFSSSNRMRI